MAVSLGKVTRRRASHLIRKGENDFPRLVWRTSQHFMCLSHLFQRKHGAHARGQLAAAEKVGKLVQPLGGHFDKGPVRRRYKAPHPITPSPLFPLPWGEGRGIEFLHFLPEAPRSHASPAAALRSIRLATVVETARSAFWSAVAAATAFRPRLIPRSGKSSSENRGNHGYDFPPCSSSGKGARAETSKGGSCCYRTPKPSAQVWAPPAQPRPTREKCRNSSSLPSPPGRGKRPVPHSDPPAIDSASMRCASVRKLSRTLVPKTEENVVRQSIVDAYQSKPRCSFRCIAHVTVGRRPVDPRLGSLT